MLVKALYCRMKTVNHDILIQDCLKNKRKAQALLFDLYKDAMFTICLRITGDYNSASDAMQEGFIAVFTGLEKFRRESSLGAWIKTIMIRTALKKLKNFSFDYDENIPDIPISIDQDLTGEELHKAIMQLDEGYRAVFVLFEVENYSHNEIADFLGISPGTSKSQLYHSKRKLKAILKKMYDYER